MNAKLTLNSVSKSFGDNHVLRDISLTINTGEVVSFIGASGSGKTTLLRCINLLETVDNGSILLDNTEITAVGLDPNPIRRRIGIVFQSFNLFPHMSIRRNVTLALTEVLDMSLIMQMRQHPICSHDSDYRTKLTHTPTDSLAVSNNVWQ